MIGAGEESKLLRGKPWVQEQGFLLPGYTYPRSVVLSALSGGRKLGQAGDNGPAEADSNSQFLVISSPCPGQRKSGRKFNSRRTPGQGLTGNKRAIPCTSLRWSGSAACLGAVLLPPPSCFRSWVELKGRGERSGWNQLPGKRLSTPWLFVRTPGEHWCCMQGQQSWREQDPCLWLCTGQVRSSGWG